GHRGPWPATDGVRDKSEGLAQPDSDSQGARPKLSKCIVTQACKDIRKLRHQKPPPAAQVQLATLRPPPPVVESRNSTTNYTADTLFAWMPMPSSHERLNFDDRFNGAER
ncbi:Hypothetical predicted protein, partial [Cloeon dipterum]